MSSADLITQWRVRVSRMKDAHYEAATVLEHMHLRLGVPVIIFSTVVGTSVFTLLQGSPSTWIRVIVGLMSLVAAVVASLQTFLRYSERAERHRIAGARYGTLKADIELLQAFPSTDAGQLSATLKAFSDRWSKIREESPAIPPRLWRRLSRRHGPQVTAGENTAAAL